MLGDGVNAPQVLLEFAFGGTSTVDPAAGFLVLDDGPVLNTGILGGVSWVQIPAEDIRRISWRRGQTSEFDSPAPGSMTVELFNYSGNYDPDNTQGAYYPNVDLGRPVWFKVVFGGVTYSRWRGYVDAIDMDTSMDPVVTITCTDGLEALGRVALGTISPAGVGETTSARVTRTLDAAGWASTLRILDTGLSTCQATTHGQAALQELGDVCATELGLMALDADGNFVFYNRTHPYTATRSTVVQATLSDSGSDVDVVDLVVSKRRDLLFNQARVTRNGGAEQVYDDTASEATYGVRTFPGQVGTLLQTDADALSLGHWVVGRFRTPQRRVTHVNVQAASQGLWTTVLPLTYLDRIRVLRTYSAHADQIDAEVLILSISEDITADSWAIGMDTRNAEQFSPLILDSATSGILNTDALA